MEENQRHLYIACEACKGKGTQCKGTQFLISFLKLFRQIDSFILTGTVSQFLGP